MPQRKTKIKPLSFGDMYGLGLIAKDPSGDSPKHIIPHLSPEAKKIAKSIVAGRKVKSSKATAAKELTKLAW